MAVGSIATAFMAIATLCLGWQTKRVAAETKRIVDEPRKEEIQRAFQSLFLNLRRDIIQYDKLNYRLNRCDMMVLDLSKKEEIQKSLSRLTAVEFSAFQKMGSLLEKLLLPKKFLQRVWSIETNINSTLIKLDNLIQNIASSSDISSEVNQTIPNNVNVIRLYQRQLACYFIVKADEQGYKEVAETMRGINEFAPDQYMQRKENYLPESGMEPELDGPYADCKIEALIARAK